MLALFSVALFARKYCPRLSLLTWSYTTYSLMSIVLGMIAYGAQFTPFPSIDTFLIKIDQALGFNQIAILNWTYAHPAIKQLMEIAYSLLGLELIFLPLVLALLFEKKSLYVLFMALILSFISGTAIYYFFPTTAPASMFFSPHFTLAQLNTFIKFFEVHNHLPITAFAGGMVAFPSFHVIWAILMIYGFKNKKYFFFPLLVINSLIIASTMLLGWHYLTDVIGAILVTAISLYVAEIIHKKYMTSSAKKVCLTIKKDKKLACRAATQQHAILETCTQHSYNRHS